MNFVEEYADGFFRLHKEQRSDEWFVARKELDGKYGCFGGTSLSAISGDLPFKTPNGVYRELIKSCPKCCEPCDHFEDWQFAEKIKMEQNEDVRRGRENEDRVQRKVQELLEVQIDEGYMGWRRFNEHIRVSPDGIDNNNVVYEFKCPRILTPGVPVYYVPQMMGEMWVYNAKRCIYGAMDVTTGKTNVYSLWFSQEYWDWLKSRADFIYQFAQEAHPDVVTLKIDFPGGNIIEREFGVNGERVVNGEISMDREFIANEEIAVNSDYNFDKIWKSVEQQSDASFRVDIESLITGIVVN